MGDVKIAVGEQQPAPSSNKTTTGATPAPQPHEKPAKPKKDDHGWALHLANLLAGTGEISGAVGQPRIHGVRTGSLNGPATGSNELVSVVTINDSRLGAEYRFPLPNAMTGYATAALAGGRSRLIGQPAQEVTASGYPLRQVDTDFNMSTWGVHAGAGTLVDLPAGMKAGGGVEFAYDHLSLDSGSSACFEDAQGQINCGRSLEGQGHRLSMGGELVFFPIPYIAVSGSVTYNADTLHVDGAPGTVEARHVDVSGGIELRIPL